MTRDGLPLSRPTGGRPVGRGTEWGQSVPLRGTPRDTPTTRQGLELGPAGLSGLRPLPAKRDKSGTPRDTGCPKRCPMGVG